MTTLVQPLDSFSALAARTYRWAKRIFWAVLCVASLLVVLEAVHLAELLAAIHPGLAWAVMGLLAVPLMLWIGWRIFIFLRTPHALIPPELPDIEIGWGERERRRYREFARRLLKRQERNPHLPDEFKSLIPGLLAEINAPLPEEDSADPVRAARELTRRIGRPVDELLAPLDQEANRLIRRAAVEVSCVTAVSPSVLLDALITLARNVDLVSRIADLYYGRPGMRGTLRVLRDVLGSAVAAGALEMVSDNLTGALTEMTGSWTTRLLGPLGQGMVNGLVTMRIGAAARKRCRSLTGTKVPWAPWRLSQYKRAFGKLYEWLGSEAGPAVTKPFTGWLDWLGSAAQATVKGRWWDQLFGWSAKGKRVDNSEPAAPNGAPDSTDPLVESGLLD